MKKELSAVKTCAPVVLFIAYGLDFAVALI